MLNRPLLLSLLLILSTLSGYGHGRPKPRKWAAAEARNETGAPSFSRHVRDARRISAFLADALLLTTAQRVAVERCTVAERTALVLAATDEDARLAQDNYLAAVRRVLALNQLCLYNALCIQLQGTALPVDGTELAVR